MRIDERSAAQAAVKTARALRPQGGFGFAIREEAAPAEAAGKSVAPAGASAVSALFQLQMEDNSPRETRKRTVRRGAKLIDQLDRLKAAFLVGADQEADWDALLEEYERPRDPNLPPEVAALLDEVDVRVAVELAKRGR
jgi:hypothetical protein